MRAKHEQRSIRARLDQIQLRDRLRKLIQSRQGFRANQNDLPQSKHRKVLSAGDRAVFGTVLAASGEQDVPCSANISRMPIRRIILFVVESGLIRRHDVVGRAEHVIAANRSREVIEREKTLLRCLDGGNDLEDVFRRRTAVRRKEIGVVRRKVVSEVVLHSQRFRLCSGVVAAVEEYTGTQRPHRPARCRCGRGAVADARRSRIEIVKDLIVHRRHRCAGDGRPGVRIRGRMQLDRDVTEVLHEIVIHQRSNEVRLSLQLVPGSRIDIRQCAEPVEDFVRAVDVGVCLRPDVEHRRVEGADLIIVDLAIRCGRSTEFGVVRAQVADLRQVRAVAAQTLQSVIHAGDRRARR